MLGMYVSPRCQTVCRYGRFRWLALGLSVLLTVTLPACGDSADAGSERTKPELVDRTGTVEDSRFHDSVQHGLPTTAEAGVVDAPDGFDLRIVWLGEGCRSAPRVELKGDGQITSAIVDPGPQIAPEGADTCPAIGLWHAVDIKASPAPADDITVIPKPEDG